MSPANKFHLFVATMTIGFMYWVITKLELWFPHPNGLPPVWRGAIAYLSASGVYGHLATALRYALHRFQFARRIILGPEYVEGTWVGFYKTGNNETRLTVEHFEQSIDGVTIKGYAFTENSDEPIEDWTSKSVSMNAVVGELTYSYNCSRVADNTTFQGQADFKFERQNPRKPPEFLNGYSADFPTSGKKCPNREKKVSVKQLALPVAWAKAKHELQLHNSHV